MASALLGADTNAPRAARSVHLHYPAPNAVAFYNELTVQQSTPGSYFMACGFSHGYFGIQEQGNGRKVVIFSVWDPTKGNDPNAVAGEERVEIVYKADDVVAKRFGGEGTGGQSFFEFDWQLHKTYKFMVQAEVHEQKTEYAAYFYLPKDNAWKHLVTFRTRAGGDHLEGLYSFLEDFRRDGKSAQQTRRALFGNGWALDINHKWQPLTKAQFTASSSEWEAKDTIDAGLSDNHFYLQTGGDTKQRTELKSTIERIQGKVEPPMMPKD